MTDVLGHIQLQTVRCFTLFYPGGSVYASDTTGRLIAVAVVSGHPGQYSFKLEGNGIAGEGFEDLLALLEGVASQLTANYLEVQFRNMPDLSNADVFDLTAGPHLHMKLQA
ncbi:hypothetical protein LJR066_005832 [Acidovorax sp. LjRoot66]|uniref:hypothetical protein n=1 Tax=Acidovorax sp. LjRoot66 TaxID=3342334 RepID=UPI003ED0F105